METNDLTFLNQLKISLSENETDTVIEQLTTYLVNDETELLDELISHKSRWLDVNKQQRLGVLAMDDFNVARNQITFALIGFISALQKKIRKRTLSPFQYGEVATDSHSVQPSASTTVTPKITEIVDEGNRKFNEKDFQGALELFEEAIKADGSVALLYSNRGLTLYNLGHVEKAMQDFDRAIKLDPAFAMAYMNRGLVKYEQLNKLQEALRDYTHAINLEPQNSLAYFNRGMAFITLNDYDRAIDDFNTVLNIDPANAEAYINRGLCKLNSQRYNESVEDFSKAIRLKGETELGYLNRGLAYYYLNDYQSALADYQQTLKMNPYSGEAYRLIGLIHSMSGEYGESIPFYDHAIKLGNDDQWSYLNRALAKTQIEQYAEAVADYQKTIELDPFNLDGWSSRGLNFYHLGEYTVAEECLIKAMKINANHRPTHSNLGVLYYQTGKYNDAIKHFLTAMKISNPDDETLLQLTGTCWYHLGIIDQSVAYFKKSIEADPNRSMAWYWYGVALEETGDKQNAMECYTHSIQLDPQGSYLSYNNRGVLKYNAGDNKGAIADYQAALAIVPTFETTLKNLKLAKDAEGGGMFNWLK